MARVTVEDCEDKVTNRFDLVLLAARRARQISAGAPITVERDNDKNPVVSLREIASDAVDHETLEDRFIKSMQKNIIKEQVNIEDDVSLEDEFAAYLNETKKETPSNDSLMMNNNKIDDETSFEDISQTLLNDED